MSGVTANAKSSLLDQACDLLEDQNQQLAQFARDFFAHADEEDLLAYSPQDLSYLAGQAWDTFQLHPTGTHEIKVFNPVAPHQSNQLDDVTVIEIMNDNMAFLVASVLGELQVAGLDFRLVLHPLFVVERDEDGNLILFKETVSAGTPGLRRESFIQIHVTRIDDAEEIEILHERLELVLRDVRLAVNDWEPMKARLEKAVQDFHTARTPYSKNQLDEAVQFLEWMSADNFTLLGMREYIFEGGVENGEMNFLTGTGLGLLNDPDVRVLRRGSEFVVMTPEIRDFLLKPEPLIIAKANVKSRVHRHVHMDYIGVKLFDENGVLNGELRIVGLFTATAYTKSTASIPYIRRKVEKVMNYHGFDPESHSGRMLGNILEGYPRDDLFQIDTETLCEFTTDILKLNDRPRIRVLARRDKFDRFVSIIAYVPKDRFTTEKRIQIGSLMAKAYDGRMSAWYASFPEGPLVRVHFIIGRDKGETPNPDREELETAISKIVRTWSDGLSETLRLTHGASQARPLIRRYATAFEDGYEATTPIDTALEDIGRLEKVTEDRPLLISFYRREGETGMQLSLRTYHLSAPLALSARVPILENLGFRVVNERTYRISPSDKPMCYLHDTTLFIEGGVGDDFCDADIERLGALFINTWGDRAENDGYNGLAMTAGMAWRDIAVLRAFSKYLRQAGIRYSEDYMWSTLNSYPSLAKLLVDLFYLRFQPSVDEEKRSKEETVLQAEFSTQLDSVVSLDDDRIIRRFKNLIEAILRTNFFQLDAEGQPKPTFAFKLDSHKIDELPKPLPYREIFVYSPRVEGVHMRFGSAARGGLRWSDRAQDYRTEVLGLVKAQQVKNAVIVPVGAKGGFLPKRLPTDGNREAFIAEGTAAYKIFINSLLDLTDNIDGENVIPPQMVVRRDNDDPYLVVAADKGTATFSDTANAISESKHFWLGDAFASGGSAGYDHKKMGITARGAWEAVKRHFREMDRDIQKEPFTVCGVGDMSGDVFGNGMLLSKAIRLVAAFDHRDIFIDPNPDPETTWVERKRLFDVGRSSWQDYDASLISKGGGIFPRSAKSIELTDEIRKLLDLEVQSCSPQELMSAILRMKADLLWFGGIGTYIRGSDETDDMVGDRANDPIRISAPELRVKVVGEGANLGITQKARIEYARRGGRCNSDAIDNSAGVNSSDVEVNIKIALGSAVKSGKLETPERNTLLADMTDEVADLVLRNNYQQTLSISLAERHALEDLGYQMRMMRQLESQGLLDRAVEYLPDDITIDERQKQGQGLSRPELGVLLAYAKLTLYDQLLQSTVPDDKYLAKELMRYFPEPMQQLYNDEIEGHRLRREIIATMLANSIINRGGPAFITRITDQTGATPAQIVRAFAAVRDAYGLTELNSQIDALDNKISGKLQLELYSAVQELVQNKVIWFLRNVSFEDGIEQAVTRFRESVSTLSPRLEEYLPEDMACRLTEETERLVHADVPFDLAARLARLTGERIIPDIVLVAERAGMSVVDVAGSYFQVSDFFRFNSIDAMARSFPIRDYYDGLALDKARSQLAEALRELTSQSIAHEAGFEGWLADVGDKAKRIRAAVDEILETNLSVSKFSVAASMLSEFSK
ncbi:NAD-glutamate dehydrogenase [Rhodobacteraceae bacterium RKSG542]|uniref:NAD-glutamate dehydrogenase n=1 Tax=Pseudovibrio flavus TaxID=2529854 RepID=UPI0012BD19C0|nr:NAD-glutamate dehydrogenase [Pseudovibrio flavus]MTI17866.1 NAD-glutamate dehydrogenase [Pseudovibrio flavus]